MPEELLHPYQYFANELNSIGNPVGVATMYYPGAGLDWESINVVLSALNNSNRRPSLLQVIYVDYDPSIKQGDVTAFAERTLRMELGLEVSDRQDLNFADFKERSAESFFPTAKEAVPACLECSGDQDFFGMRWLYRDARLSFTYLKTEAIFTYKILLKNKVFPDLVVLQDHGWGGGWTPFSGPESLLLAASKRHMPKYLYVASNGKPWPDYLKVSSAYAGRGQMHDHDRTLYRYKHN